MTESDTIETEFLVLRVTQYGENSLIAAGFTPELGKLSFAIHGGKGSGRRGVTPFRLFCHLKVKYVPSSRELQKCVSAELVDDFSAVSHDYERYSCACWLSQFSLTNVLPGMPTEYYFRAVSVAFSRLAKTVLPVPAILTGVLLVYMQENGMLPQMEGDVRRQSQCQLLLQMALGGDVPALQKQNWLAIRDWTIGVLRQTDCILPAF
ncbi:MAG: recombination protein O N-terminal domain-containing protein [Victivallales bacterium]|nr:recombination protein O N-terminal domain-containing protein [Victivallales bacterium]